MPARILVATKSVQPKPGAIATFTSAQEMAQWARDKGYRYVEGSRGLFVLADKSKEPSQ